MRTLVFPVPFLPQGPNSSGSGKGRKSGTHQMDQWSLTRVKAEWRRIIRVCLPPDYPMFGHGPVHIGVVRCAIGMMDRDNAVAAMKYVIDGLVHAQVIDNDNQEVVYGVDVVQYKVKKGRQTGIVVFVEEVAPRPNDALFITEYAADMLQYNSSPFVTEANMYSLRGALRKE